MTTTKHFPVEIWTVVFEYIRLDGSMHARRRMIDRCETAIWRGAREAEALAELPLYERRIWRQAQAYYQVNRSLRAVAQNLQLTMRLLRFCRSPCPELPSSIRLRENGQWASCVRSDAMDRDERIVILPVDDSMRPCLAIDLFHPDRFSVVRARYNIAPSQNDDQRALQDLLDKNRIFRTSGLSGDGRPLTHSRGQRLGERQPTYDRWQRRGNRQPSYPDRHPLYGSDVFRSIRRVELLFAAPRESLEELAKRYAQRFKTRIEEEWRALGVVGEVVLLY